MTKIPAFSENELTVVDHVPNPGVNSAIPVYNFPVTPLEGMRALYNRQAIWQLMTCFGAETVTFCPRVIPDYQARGSIMDATASMGSPGVKGGQDMFGREWIFEPEIGGSMVVPGSPLCDDANDLEDLLVWPDPDSWDWQGSKLENSEFFVEGKYYMNMFMNGFFERLISLMDFENALVALYDDSQQEAVKSFFNKLADLYIRIFGHLLDNFPQIAGVCFHDDWGGGNDTFFSPDTALQMIVPYMRKVTDYLHSRGIICDFHSCGKNYKQVPNMIAAGWDSWTPQDINDTLAIYDEFGDLIIIATIPNNFDPEITTEEEQRALARAYVERVCSPTKPSAINMYARKLSCMTDIFREEVYRHSRLVYAG